MQDLSSQTKIGRKEKFIVFAFLLVLLIWTTFIACNDLTGMVGDTALYAQITETIANTGRADGQIFSNTQYYLDQKIQDMQVDERLANDKNFETPQMQGRNMLHFHFFLILYLLAPFTWLFRAIDVVTAAQCFSSIACLWFVYLIMRERGCALLWTALTLVLVVVHPGFGISYYGAFYPDRLFWGGGMYLVWACSQKKISRIHFVASVALCMLMGERSALFAGMFVLAHAIFYWEQHPEIKLFRLAVGIIAVVYSMLLMKNILSNMYYTESFLGLYKNLLIPAVQAKAMKYLFINVILFGIVALFNWRGAVIGYASLIPNLLMNIGGAEKLGWSLHYHIYYIVILIWAMISGSASLYKMAKGKKVLGVPCVILGSLLLCAQIVFLSCIEPYTPKIAFDKVNARNNLLYASASQTKLLYIDRLDNIIDDMQNRLSELIPEGAKVSSVEFAMPSIYYNRQINIFPMGIKDADYVVASYTQDSDGSITYSGATTYSGMEETKRFNQEVFQRMFSDYGYDERDATYFQAFGIVVLPRKSR